MESYCFFVRRRFTVFTVLLRRRGASVYFLAPNGALTISGRVHFIPLLLRCQCNQRELIHCHSNHESGCEIKTNFLFLFPFFSRLASAAPNINMHEAESMRINRLLNMSIEA